MVKLNWSQRAGHISSRTCRPPAVDRLDRFIGLVAALAETEIVQPVEGGQHHQAHDRGARPPSCRPWTRGFGIESLDGLDEFGAGPGMQSAFVDDQHLPRHAHACPSLPVQHAACDIDVLRPASEAS